MFSFGRLRTLFGGLIPPKPPVAMGLVQKKIFCTCSVQSRNQFVEPDGAILGGAQIFKTMSNTFFHGK